MSARERGEEGGCTCKEGEVAVCVSEGRREGARVSKERWQMCIQLKQNGMGNQQFGNET